MEMEFRPQYIKSNINDINCSIYKSVEFTRDKTRETCLKADEVGGCKLM